MSLLSSPVMINYFCSKKEFVSLGLFYKLSHVIIGVNINFMLLLIMPFVLLLCCSLMSLAGFEFLVLVMFDFLGKLNFLHKLYRPMVHL